MALSMTGILAQSVPFKHTNMHTGNNIKAHSNMSDVKDKLREGGRLPTIYIIGAQKGGSSSLYELMVKHPQLCGGDRKENHYFDHPLNYEMGTAYFKSMYFDEKCNKVKGTHFVDGTPILHYPSVWQRIYDTYSDTPHIRDSLKFIVMLREPASRDYSWYEHVTRTGEVELFAFLQHFLPVDDFQTKLVLIQYVITTDIFMGEKFSDVKTMNETFVGNYTIFKKGYYVDQLLAFTNVFKRSQIMVISSVGMYKDTAGMMENIRKFINVEEDDSFLGQLPHGTRPSV
jgi:hypothetical protein